MKIILLAVILAICATLIAGQPDRKVILTPHENAFIGNEFQAGTHVAGATGTFGGSGLAGSGTRNVIGMGGVTGLKDFFTRCLGIGFDDTLRNIIVTGQRFKNLRGNLFVRIPIGSHRVAPHRIAGGGAMWGNNNTHGDGSLRDGIEYRIIPGIGLLADSRHLYGNCCLYESLSRAGLRFVF